MTPLATAILGQAAKPYIVVYTDNDDRAPASMGELYSGQTRQLQLAVEIGVASSIRTPAGALTLQFAATDEGMEWAVDVIESQVIAALYGDPKSEWGELFKRMAPYVLRMPSRRGGQAERGVRWAARRSVFIVRTIYDIAPGTVPDPKHPIYDFIAMARAHPALSVVDSADILEHLLLKNAAPLWQQAQAILGLNRQATLNIVPEGAPLPWGDDGEKPVEEKPFDPEAGEFEHRVEQIDLTDDSATNFFNAEPIIIGSPIIKPPGGA